MELVANVWPVFDGNTRIVQRFLARAYAMEASDETISATLKALAPSDFRLAKAFAIPERFTVVSKYGSLQGAVTLGDFHEYSAAILAPAFEAIEADFARLQGIAIPTSGAPIGIGIIPKFPGEPYLLVTSLLETATGALVPQLASN
jgi:hypothetical protein